MTAADVFAGDIAALAAFFRSVGVDSFTVGCDSLYISMHTETDDACRAVFATLVKQGARSRREPEFTGNAENHWLASMLELGGFTVSLYGPHHAGAFKRGGEAIDVELPRLAVGQEPKTP